MKYLTALLVVLTLLLSPAWAPAAEELPEPRRIPTPELLDAYGQQWMAYTWDQYISLLEFDVELHYALEAREVLELVIGDLERQLSQMARESEEALSQYDVLFSQYRQAEEDLGQAIEQLEAWETGDLCERNPPVFWMSTTAAALTAALLLLLIR